MKIIESENLVITSTLESLVFPMLLNFLIGWYLNILNIFKIFDLMLLQDLNTHLGISLLQQNQFFVIFSFNVFAWKLWKRFAWKDNYKMDKVPIFRRWEMIFFRVTLLFLRGDPWWMLGWCSVSPTGFWNTFGYLWLHEILDANKNARK